MDEQTLLEKSWFVDTVLEFINQGITDPEKLVTEDMLNAQYVKEGKFMPNPCNEITYPQPDYFSLDN